VQGVIIETMTITLTAEQQRWLEAEVAAGRIASVEEAVRLAVDLIMPVDTTDLSWAKPYLDEAREQVARGEYVEHSDLKRELAERIKSLR
jgi:Arc/MetJ-type ribon-helix-helix transcriptional regulator